MISRTSASYFARFELFSVWDEVRHIARLGTPIALAQFALMTMSLIDTAILGHVSKSDLAAGALGRNIGFSAQTVAIGLAMGLETLASQAVGAGRPDRAWGSFVTSLRAIFYSWPLTVLASLAYTLALPHLGVSASVVWRTRLFLFAWAPGLLAFPFFIVAKTFLQAHGRTRPALIAAIVANIVNVVVCNLLVRGDEALVSIGLHGIGLPRLGALGSGIALSVAGWVLVAIVLRAAWVLRPEKKARDEAKVSLREVLRVGLPVGAQMFAEIGVFAFMALLTGWFGDAAVSANQIALGLASFTFMGALGVSGATAVRVGHAIGAGKSARRAGLTGIALGACVMGAGVVAFTAIPAHLVGIFTDDPEIVTLGARLVRVAAFFQLFDGVQAVGAGALRGAGDVRFTFVAGAISYWIVGLPLALLFAFPGGHATVGLWWGLSASLVCAAALFLARFAWITRART